MRKVLVKEIHELTELETDCLLANHDVQTEIVAYANECETDWFNDVFYCIEDSLSTYSICESFNSYIRVKDYQAFYEGVMRMHDWYDFFYGSDIINRIDNIYETYYTEVETNEFVKLMKPLENEIASLLGDYVNYYTSYEQLEYETDYILSWLEGRYDTECVVDGGNVKILYY